MNEWHESNGETHWRSFSVRNAYLSIIGCHICYRLIFSTQFKDYNTCMFSFVISPQPDSPTEARAKTPLQAIPRLVRSPSGSVYGKQTLFPILFHFFPTNIIFYGLWRCFLLGLASFRTVKKVYIILSIALKNLPSLSFFFFWKSYNVFGLALIIYY